MNNIGFGDLVISHRIEKMKRGMHKDKETIGKEIPVESSTPTANRTPWEAPKSYRLGALPLAQKMPWGCGALQLLQQL